MATLQDLFPGGFPRPGTVYIYNNNSLLIPLQSDVHEVFDTTVSLPSSSSSEQNSTVLTSSNEIQSIDIQNSSVNGMPLQSPFLNPQIHIRRRLILNHFLAVLIRVINNDERQIQLYNADRAQRNQEMTQRRRSRRVAIALIAEEITLTRGSQTHQQATQEPHGHWMHDILQHWMTDSLQQIIEQIVQAYLLSDEPPPRHTSRAFIQSLPEIPINSVEYGDKCPVCFEEFRRPNTPSDTTSDSQQGHISRVSDVSTTPLISATALFKEENTNRTNAPPNEQSLSSTPMISDERHETERKSVEPILMLPCKHKFDKNCLLRWLADHNTCPVCRYTLPLEHEVKEHAVK
jgi:hypothetical protein